MTADRTASYDVRNSYRPLSGIAVGRLSRPLSLLIHSFSLKSAFDASQLFSWSQCFVAKQYVVRYSKTVWRTECKVPRQKHDRRLQVTTLSVLFTDHERHSAQRHRQTDRQTNDIIMPIIVTVDHSAFNSTITNKLTTTYDGIEEQCTND